jgi:hypothetical protein
LQIFSNAAEVESMTRSSKLRQFAISLIVLTCSSFVFYNSYRLLRPFADPEPTYFPGRGKMPLVVMGFQFAGFNDGKKILSIKAAKHAIEKKKMGFISLGAGYIANYKNAVVDIYGRQIRNHPYSKKDSRIVAYTYNAIFSAETMPILSQKDIAFLRFEPVKINFYNDNSLLTEIVAHSATIDPRKKRIFLKGQILAKSASRSLMTDRLDLISDNGFMEATSHFILKTPEKHITGKHLTSDIGLNIMKVQ